MKRTLKKRALIRCAILILAAILIETIVYSYLAVKTGLEDTKTNSLESLQSLNSYLESYLDEVDSIAKDVNYNYYLQSYLTEAIQEENRYTEPSNIKNMRAYEMSSEAFSSTLLDRPDVTSIMIFGKEKLLFYKSLYEYHNVIIDFSSQDWYDLAVRNPHSCVVTGPHDFAFLEGDYETISISREIQSCEDGSFLGVILVNLNLNKIAEISEIYHTGEKELFFVTNADGNLIYQQQRGEQEYQFDNAQILKLKEQFSETKNESGTIQLGNTTYFAVASTMAKTGWVLYDLKPYSKLLSEIIKNGILIIISMTITLLIALLVLSGIISGILRPIEKLQRHMERVNLENMNQQVPVDRDDEVGKLSSNFNEMLERIETLKEQVVREQEDKRRYELQALQAQINPHFLYNTLDSIIWMAETGDPNVVKMTEALAKLFRISLNKGSEEILLKRELEHVTNYLIIQKMRYADKFTYEISMAPETANHTVIKLILQPIVENCIYHGIKKKKGSGHIEVRSLIRDELLVIQIKDDGCGMSQELKERILSDEIEPENISGSGIGIKNVNERIKLRFGEQYGLYFESELNQGTLVEIRLPADRTTTESEAGR